MRKIVWFCFLAMPWVLPLKAQISYLEHKEILAKTDSCLQFTYGCRFAEAHYIQQELEKLSPDHPAPPFLKALIIYWENFPILPENDLCEVFDALMEESVDRAESLLDKPGTHMEGVFFDLFGRAFQAMFWADNGKANRAAGDLRTMYKRTKESFHMVEDFPEFYFSSGLYNYYIEAYPEAHPVYKPLVAFMHEGDRDLGLRHLNLAIQKTVFLRVEATLFMALIQANYENDLKTAALYADKLILEFPENIYYQGLTIGIWLHLEQFSRVRDQLPRLKAQRDPYSNMVLTLAEAFLAEKEEGNEKEAGNNYQDVIAQAEELGPITDMYKAMALMGLSRLHETRGLHSAARRYYRKAEKLTAYPFILEQL